jgi:hypothetical protein
MRPTTDPQAVLQHAYELLQQEAQLSAAECQFYEEEIRRWIDERRAFITRMRLHACPGWLPSYRPLRCCRNWLHRHLRANTAASVMRRWPCGLIFVGGRDGLGRRSPRKARPSFRTAALHGARSMCCGAGPTDKSLASRRRRNASLKSLPANAPRRTGILAMRSAPTLTALGPTAGRPSGMPRPGSARPAGRRSIGLRNWLKRARCAPRRGAFSCAEIHLACSFCYRMYFLDFV